MNSAFDSRELAAALRGFIERAIPDADTARQVLAAVDSNASGNGFEMWAALDQRVGKAETSELRSRLEQVRSDFEEGFAAAEIRRLKQTFGESEDSGWATLLSTVADAVARSRWRFARRLCEQSFPLTRDRAEQIQKTSRAVYAMSQSRWVEADDQIAFLANCPVVPDLIRAKLLAFLGQIELVLFNKADRAKEFFKRAAELAPNEPAVLNGLGDFYVQEKDSVQAKTYYEKAIRLVPSEPGGYVGMGECFENERAFDAAEDWYRKAVTAAGGDGLGYSRLLRLCGQPELFGAREKTVQPLLETIIAVWPEEECQANIDAGSVYEKNGDLSRARAFYEAAVALDPLRPGSYTALAACCEKQKKGNEAEAFYRKAIEVAPDCYDGYWGLTRFYEDGNQWEQALGWYRKAPLHNKLWAGIVRAKIGEMLANLEQYPEAERLLKDELRKDNSNDNAREALHAIAEGYRKGARKDDALRLYGEILEILGNAYRGEYHNRLGNLYYDLSEYQQAMEHYQQAVVLSPTDAIYFHNLAGAHRELKNFDLARRELKHALEIDRDEKKFNDKLGLIENAEGNYLYGQGRYREAIRNYEQAVLLLKNDAIVLSNLAGAWERLNEGDRSESMNHAVEALEQADRLAPTRGYGKKAQSLRRRVELALRYGEKIFNPLDFVTPIRIEVAQNLVPLTQGTAEGGLSDSLSKSIINMRARVLQQLGVHLPGIRFRGEDGTLAFGGYVISLMETPLVLGSVSVDQRFYLGAIESLSSLGVTGSPGSVGNSQIRGLWIHERDWPKVISAGLELWDPMEYVVRHLETIIHSNLSEFVGHQEVASLLAGLSREKLEGFRSTPEKLSALTAVCKGLAGERVPIAPFNAVCEVFEKLYSTNAGGQRIVEAIRASNLFRNQLPGNSSDCVHLPTGTRFETAIRSCVYRTGDRSLLAMEPELCQSVLAAVRNQIPTGQSAICVDDPELRPLLRLLIDMEFPGVPVLSKRELLSGIEAQNAHLIELDESQAAVPTEFTTPSSIHVEATSPGTVEMDATSPPGIVVFVNRAFVSNRAAADDRTIEEIFPMIQEGLFYELGILLPAVRLELDDKLTGNEFRFRLNGESFPVAAGLEPDEFLVNDTVDRLRLLGIEGRSTVNPANGNAGTIVREGTAQSDTCRKAGLTTWGPIGFLALMLSREIRRTAAAFQTLSVTQYILESLGATFPDLVDAATKRFSTAQIMGTLKDLLDEEISIRDLRTILESMLLIGTAVDVDLSRFIVFVSPAERLLPVRGGPSHTLTVTDYSNWARCAMKRYLSHKYAKGSSTLVVYLIDPEIERRLADSDVRPLTEDELAKLIKAVSEEISGLPPSSQIPSLLTSIEVRRTLRDLLKKNYPDLAILSYQELSQELNIQPIARISWS